MCFLLAVRQSSLLYFSYQTIQSLLCPSLSHHVKSLRLQVL